MTRNGLLFLPALAMFACAMPDMAGAKSKAYCRDFARDVADRHVNGGDVVAGAVIGAAVLAGTPALAQDITAAFTHCCHHHFNIGYCSSHCCCHHT